MRELLQEPSDIRLRFLQKTEFGGNTVTFYNESRPDVFLKLNKLFAMATAIAFFCVPVVHTWGAPTTQIICKRHFVHSYKRYL